MAETDFLKQLLATLKEGRAQLAHEAIERRILALAKRAA